MTDIIARGMAGKALKAIAEGGTSELVFSDTTPAPNADVGKAGISTQASRGDHQHPVDLSRASQVEMNEAKGKISALEADKLNKQTNDGTKVEVYAFTGDVQNTIELTDTPTAGKIAEYDQVTGNLKTGTPTTGSEAVNKEYFDLNKGVKSYNDLTDRPTIPTVTNDFTNEYKNRLDTLTDDYIKSLVEDGSEVSY